MHDPCSPRTQPKKTIPYINHQAAWYLEGIRLCSTRIKTSNHVSSSFWKLLEFFLEVMILLNTDVISIYCMCLELLWCSSLTHSFSGRNYSENFNEVETKRSWVHCFFLLIITFTKLPNLMRVRFSNLKLRSLDR